MKSLIIAGDVVPTEFNTKFFQNGSIDKIIDTELANIWYQADYRVFNLEAPITDEANPIIKNGSHLRVSNKEFPGILQLKPDLVSLANNHILDHGESALLDTINLLNKNNIKTVGAGKNILEADNLYIQNINGMKVAIYSCAEWEFSIATEENGGANPFDPLYTLDRLVEIRKQVDYLIVLFHAGVEQYRYPTPSLQKECRRMVDKGADLIVCQHSHCIGSSEIYNGSTIVYGQGNFIFDKLNNEFWNSGILVKVDFNTDTKPKIHFIPYYNDKHHLKKAGIEHSNIIENFNQRSQEISDKNFVIHEYKKLVEQKENFYFRNIIGMNKWIARMDRRLLNNSILKHKLNKQYLAQLFNYTLTSAHKDIIEESIKAKIR